MLTYATRDVLQQGCSLLDRLSPEAYVLPLGGSVGGTIGAHYRHVLDHFSCLLAGIQTGTVNYDERNRDPRIETSLSYARSVTSGLIGRLFGLSHETLNRQCLVTYSVGYGQVQGEPVPSNVAREVMFCVGHAIHHYAILKLMCTRLDVALPREFGVAPSTLKHLEVTSRVSRSRLQ